MVAPRAGDRFNDKQKITFAFKKTNPESMNENVKVDSHTGRMGAHQEILKQKQLLQVGSEIVYRLTVLAYLNQS